MNHGNFIAYYLQMASGLDLIIVPLWNKKPLMCVRNQSQSKVNQTRKKNFLNHDHVFKKLTWNYKRE